MELEIYQVAILLTTLFSGCDTRPAASRKTLTARQRPPFVEYQGSLQIRELTFRERPRLVKNVLKSWIKRQSVTQKLKTTEKKTVNSLADLIANRRQNGSARVRHRRFVTQGSQWPVGTITWNIDQWSQHLSNADVNRTFVRAFRIWAEVSPLTFRWLDPPAAVDITIKFATGQHGDSLPFDGPGKVRAHAFYPDNGGDIHFDDDEPWTVSTASGNSVNLFRAAVHEIGHSLGLQHSSVANSIMSSTVDLHGDGVVLDDDDVAGIQSISGKCRPKMQSIESWMANGKTYIFSGGDYWRLDDAKGESERGYPAKISEGWLNIPNDIDEIVLWGHNWAIYFFKGHQYWKYDDLNDEVADGYPRNISEGWPGLPADGIDAGFTHNDWVTYFFKNDKVYKYDNYADNVASGYPKQISNEWYGVPDNIDSVFRWYSNGKTYFFKDDNFWEWNSTANYVNSPGLIGSSGWKNLCEV